MRKSLLAVFMAASVLFALAPQTPGYQTRERERTRTTVNTGGDDDRGDFAEKDEFHQTYQLSAGARVEVQGINGLAEIETWKEAPPKSR